MDSTNLKSLDPISRAHPVNEARHISKRRVAGLIAIAVCLAAGLVTAVGYWQQRQREANLRTLPEVLWVTDRDFSRYYSPGTTESQEVVQALIGQDHSLGERRFDTFILYRSGLAETDPSREPLLILGFDPSSIRAEQKKHSQ